MKKYDIFYQSFHKGYFNKFRYQYEKFKGRSITIKRFNNITANLCLSYHNYDNVASGYFFNKISIEYIKEQMSENNNKFILFDVIEFLPTDYLLAIYFKFNSVTKRIKIINISIES